MNRSYRYGIELECFVPYQATDELISEVGKIGFRCGSDGSLSRSDDNYSGIEIKSDGPMHYTQLNEKMHKLETLLDQYQVTVNKSCGFHVHVSNKKFFNRTFIKRLTLLWIGLEDVLLATQPQSRLNNRYCQRKLSEYVMNSHRSLPQKKMDLINELGNMNRYYTLNYTALQAHGTIEVRMHAGTTNATKVINWVRLVTSIFEYVMERYDSKQVTQLFELDINEDKVSKVFDLLGVSDDLRTFYSKRVQKFLFGVLAEQQQAAKKLEELRPAREQAEKRYQLAQRSVRNLEDRVSRYRSLFRTND